MKEKEFEQIFAGYHELPGMEFKGPGFVTNKDFLNDLVKIGIRLSNKRDGGSIIIGIDEDKQNNTFIPTGLTEAEVSSLRYDDISDKFNKYTEPPIRFEMDNFEYKNKKFIRLKIYEFEDIPVLCKKDMADSSGKTVLKAGAIYLNTLGKSQTTEQLSYFELRNLLDLAVEKGIQRFVNQAYTAGLNLAGDIRASDQGLFHQELQTILNSATAQIRSRGYWQVVIRPLKFNKKQIPKLQELLPLLKRSVVTTAGKNFPALAWGKEPKKGQDWIGESVEVGLQQEDWRLYQSAQFVSLFTIREDWAEISSDSSEKDWHPGKWLRMKNIIFHITEIFAFAARLALTDAYKNVSKIHIEITLNKLEGRKIITDPRSSWLVTKSSEFNDSDFHYSEDISRTELIANYREHTIDVIEDLLYRFDVDLSRALISQYISAMQ